MEKLLSVSSSPHIKEKHSIQSIMLDVIIALIPALTASVWIFGFRALLVTLISCISCVFFEWIWQKFTKQPITIKDLSAIVTGMLIAYNLPANVPIYVVIVGAFVAIILAKQIFGGIGQNFINPALAARAFLLAAYPTQLTSFTQPLDISGGLSSVDAITSATPLALMKMGNIESLPDFMEVFIGTIAGSLGEVSALALLLGAAYLLVRKVITWHIPVFYLATLFIMTFIFGGQGAYISFYSLFLGGAILSGFFMATDYTTTPMTLKGQIIYAIGAGIIAAIIRLFGGYPEGVSYSILIMNLVVPIIDRYVKVKRFGEVNKA